MNRSRIQKTIFTLLAALSITGYGYLVFAAPPAGGYEYAETLDPDCAPGDADCLVNIPSPTNGLETIGDDFGLGGLLTQITNIETDGNLFLIGADLDSAAQTGLFVQTPAAGVNVAGVTTTGVLGTASVSVLNLFGAVATEMTYTDTASENQYKITANDAGVDLVLTPGDSAGPDDVTGFFVRDTGTVNFGLYSNTPLMNYHTSWSVWDGAAYDMLMRLENSGELQLFLYGSSRDDTGTTTPINFLYTDANGRMLSSPVSALADLGWGLTGNSGTTAGTNFIGTTDNVALVLKSNDGQIARLFPDASYIFGIYETLDWDVGVASEETKFFYDASNQSFRMGSICSDSWDPSGGSVGQRSIAIGFAYPGCAAEGPIASGDLSIAIGRSSVASGQDSFALGVNNQASGLQSFAFGISSVASGVNATTMGSSSTASGQSSTAFGYSTEATRFASTAFGSDTLASGREATAFGRETVAYSWTETAMGLFNTAYTPQGDDFNEWFGEDRALVIGNGTDSGSLSDAFTVLRNAKVGINYDNFENTADADMLQVNGSILSSDLSSCSLEADADGTIICTPSDARLKTNIERLSYGLDTIIALNPVSYVFSNTDRFGSDQKIGFLAQELQDIVPEMVTDTGEYLSVNYSAITPVIVSAIQEMNLNVIDMDNMETENAWRDAIAAWLGNTANGITEFFSKRVTTEEFCLRDENGESCYTRSQLDAALNNTSDSTTVIYSAGDSGSISTPSETDVGSDPDMSDTENTTGDSNETATFPESTDSGSGDSGTTEGLPGAE